jgi:hypothetical protein
VNAVGRSATEVSGDDTDFGIGNRERCRQVGIFQVKVGEDPELHETSFALVHLTVRARAFLSSGLPNGIMDAGRSPKET